jgi:hypothetical protein
MGAIPFLGMVILGIRYYQRQQYVRQEIHLSAQAVLESYWVIGAWTILLGGVWQLLHIFWLLTYTTWFWLLWGHMLVYLWAIFFQKKDVAMIAHGWWRVSWWLIMRQAMQFNDWWLLMDMISMMISLSFAMYACIVFVLGTTWVKINRRIPALLFVFSQLTILVGVIYYADTFSLRTLLWGQIYLWILYGFLQRVRHERNMPLKEVDEETEDPLHLILRGEQLHDQKVFVAVPEGSLRDVVAQIWSEIMKKLPAWSFRVLASLNLLFMSVQIVLVLWWKTGDVWIWIDIWFWVSILVYIMNYFVLQQQRIDVWGQRAMTFLLINFGIYLTIYHIFGNVPIYLVGCGVIWSLANAVVMIHLRWSSLRTLLTDKDYQYWLFGNMLAIIANSYFMFLLPMSLQLRFTLVMIYLALQALFLKYQINPLDKKSLRK